ncbi:drug/metabolite exporter YedA [Pseudoxanthomonas helianthi]|uniref:Drug/metabolite exporter YedA n=1 Tax=Pseudoxanthomonas helianthi TaxID=1453541 RepID=A0A940X4I9_9GAMM|nr:drug/metabolite exporter YedA [Pseudoxanthomonas helianthi]MBP3984253.1 drug/metabolite exporter YedA [Pseudoxanthomonas helianthi]
MNTTTAVPAATSTRWGVPLALAAVYVIWGSTYLAIRFALEGGFPPFLLGGIRFVVAGSILFALLRLRGVAAPTLPQWRNAAVMGVLLLVLGNGLVNFAEKSVSSGIAAVAVASAPMWFGIFASLRGERPSVLEWLGIAIGFLGVLWLNAGAAHDASMVGLIALVIAAISWSFGSVWSRGRDLASPFMTAAAQMLCGGVAMGIVGLVSGERLHALPSASGLAAFAYLVVFGSLLGFSAYVWLLHHVRPALAGSYAYVNPAIAVVLGAWLAHERFTASEFGAMAVIVAGVVVISIGKLKKQVAEKRT